MDHINFLPFPTLYTTRLNLREIIPTDNHAILTLRSNHTVMAYFDSPMAKTLDDARTLIEGYTDGIQNNNAIIWAISQKHDPKLIGTISFWRIVKDHFRAEIGYLLHPDFHRKGIMQEAMEAVLDYGFDVLKLHSVEANVNPHNAASIRLLEKNQFIREGYFKENYYFEGKFFDTATYSLVRHPANR